MMDVDIVVKSHVGLTADYFSKRKGDISKMTLSGEPLGDEMRITFTDNCSDLNGKRFLLRGNRDRRFSRVPSDPRNSSPDDPFLSIVVSDNYDVKGMYYFLFPGNDQGGGWSGGTP